jgi:hypothetical protein
VFGPRNRRIRRCLLLRLADFATGQDSLRFQLQIIDLVKISADCQTDEIQDLVLQTIELVNVSLLSPSVLGRANY